MGWLLVWLLLVAGLSRAFHDALSHDATCLAHWGTWWDASTSWKLKYKDGDETKGSAFPGSRTWLVFLTDAWHGSNFLTWFCADTAFLLAAFPVYRWWAIGAVVARRVVFEPVYRILRK